MRKVIESFKTILIVYLVISMIFLWSKNIDQQISGVLENEKDETVLDSEFWIFSNSATAPSKLLADSNYFSPLSITLCVNGNFYTSSTNRALTTILWNNEKPLVKEIFSSNYICQVSSEEAWISALSLDDFVIINFPGALPYMTICAFSDKTDNFCEGEICAVKTMLLFPDENNVVSALAYDEDGKFYKFSVLEDTDSPLIYDFNSNNLSTYTINEGFITSMPSIYFSEALPSNHEVLLEAPRLSNIVITNPVAALFDEKDSSLSNSAVISTPTIVSLLENFNISASTVGIYTDAMSRLIFINSDTRLAIDKNGTIDYAISNETNAHILTSELLQSERSQFSSFEQITAATQFLNTFRGAFIKNTCELLLENISFSNGLTTYRFGYYYDACKITSAEFDTSVTLTFDPMGLVSASITPLFIDKTSAYADTVLTQANIPETLALSLTGTEHTITDLKPMYFFEAYNKPVAPVWILEKERG